MFLAKTFASVMESVRIDEARFIDPIPSTLTCAICIQLVVDPKECIGCDKLHCSPCLDRVKATDNKCPNCRCSLNLKGMNRNFKEAVYDKLRLKCCNFDHGCEIILLGSLQKHESECHFTRAICGLCNVEIFLRDLDDHTQGCEHRLVQCEHCKHNFKFKDLESHHGICEDYPVVCCEANKHEQVEFANTCVRMSRKNLIAHKTECPFRVSPCVYCKEGVQAHFLEKHHESFCSEYYRECKHCHDRFFVEGDHFVQCPMEVLPCKWKGCKMSRTRCTVTEHEALCKFREVSCHQCEDIVPYCFISKHIRNNSCFVSCKWCDEQCRKHSLAQHYRECSKNIPCPVNGCHHKCLPDELDKHLSDPAVALQHINTLLLKNREQAELIEEQTELLGNVQTERDKTEKLEKMNNQKSNEIFALTAASIVQRSAHRDVTEKLDTLKKEILGFQNILQKGTKVCSY